MAPLSNFFRRSDGSTDPANGGPVTCRPAERHQVHAALRLILGVNGRLADEETVVDFLRLSVHRGIDLNYLWVAERAGRIAWAVLPIVSPGRTMLLLAPPGDRPRGTPAGDDAAAQLLEAATAHFAARGIQLAQSLLDPSDNAARQLYVGRGFQEVAELHYLHADVRKSIPAPPLPAGFNWLHYSAASHDTFATTILQTYQNSLDCPGLNGLRDIEDVITGHKASGHTFDPSWWFILLENEQPRAVLLLAKTSHENTTELVYLGLIPEARGRGLGDLAMRQALHVVGSSAPPKATLALAVDAHNAPALRLYHRHGMKHVGSKLAMMRELRHDPVEAPPRPTVSDVGARE